MDDVLTFLGTAAQEFGLELSAAQLAQFGRYQALLTEWNQRLNLTRIIEPRDVAIRHFLDALTCATVTGDLNGRSLIDVGTGAGFPGVPLKILYPQLNLTLVDSVTKKTTFLTAVATELGLSNVTIVDQRAEEIGQDPEYREQYDWVVARSVAEMRVLAEYLLPLCRVGGTVLAQKGRNAPDEVAAARQAIRVLGGERPELHEIQLPEHNQQHYLVVVPKARPTSKKFPRRPGMPGKRPL